MSSMPTKLRRREFLKISALASTVPIVGAFPALAAAPGPVGDDAAGLTAYELGPQIWIRYHNRPLTCYRAHRSQKYPYLYPLSGPVTGLSLTDETTLPYPHHRSLFFGCDRVNGGNYWQEGFETGQILSSSPKLAKATKESIEILDACDWQKPDGAIVMKDRRKLTFTVPSENLRFIDWEIEWQAVESVVVQKTNHALFSMRAALDITPKAGGNLVNAEGLTGEKGTFGQKSGWCGFYGKRAAVPSVVEGIAIMDHPGNPWAPTPWFTRDYGFASPTPMNFMEKPWELGAGKSVRMRYRVVLHAGSQQDAGLDRVYRSWAAS